MSHVDRRPRRAGQRGTALLEFAIVLPVFLVLLFGTIDYGWYLLVYQTSSTAAREGARTATTWAGACPNAGAITAGTTAAQNELATLNLVAYSTVNITCGAIPGTPDPLFQVDITVSFPRLTGVPLVPLPDAMGGAPSGFTSVHTRALMRGSH